MSNPQAEKAQPTDAASRHQTAWEQLRLTLFTLLTILVCVAAARLQA